MKWPRKKKKKLKKFVYSLPAIEPFFEKCGQGAMIKSGDWVVYTSVEVAKEAEKEFWEELKNRGNEKN